MTTAEQLDHRPLGFGKYRGCTPNQIAEQDPKYIIWMYETIKETQWCSNLLYRACQEELRENKYNDGYGPND